MRQAVYEDLPRGNGPVSTARRAVARRRGRRSGPGRGAPARHRARRVGMGPRPAADRRRRARRRGAPGTAAVLLRRAVASHPRRAAGRDAARARPGRTAWREPAAVARLRQARDGDREPALHRSAAASWPPPSPAGPRVDEASAVLEAGDRRDGPDHETALMLEAQLFGLSQASDALAATGGAVRLERVCSGIFGAPHRASGWPWRPTCSTGPLSGREAPRRWRRVAGVWLSETGGS